MSGSPPDELRVAIGTRVRLSVAFVDEDGEAVTGATVTLKAKDPAGTVTTITATETPASSGTYIGGFDCEIAGRWHGRAECDSPLAARETSWYVEESDVE
jgi:hypothetical protein